MGKGGIVRHVIGSVDPQGVSLAAFKKPTHEELAHDFLWRLHKRTPAAGEIAITAAVEHVGFEQLDLHRHREPVVWPARPGRRAGRRTSS